MKANGGRQEPTFDSCSMFIDGSKSDAFLLYADHFSSWPRTEGTQVVYTEWCRHTVQRRIDIYFYFILGDLISYAPTWVEGSSDRSEGIHYRSYKHKHILWSTAFPEEIVKRKCTQLCTPH